MRAHAWPRPWSQWPVPPKGPPFPLDRTAEHRGARPDELRGARGRIGLAATLHVLISSSDQVTIRDVDPANPSYVNGLPASERTLDARRPHPDRAARRSCSPSRRDAVADRRATSSDDPSRAALDDRDAARRRVHRRARRPSACRPRGWSSDLAGLMRVSAAISAVRGLVGARAAAHRADRRRRARRSRRGDPLAVIERREIASAVGTRSPGRRRADPAGEPAGDRSRAAAKPSACVATRAVGGSSVLAAPLVAFDQVLGAIYLESDSPDRPFDERRLRLADVDRVGRGHRARVRAARRGAGRREPPAAGRARGRSPDHRRQPGDAGALPAASGAWRRATRRC